MPSSHDLSVENLRIHDHALSKHAATVKSASSHAASARPPSKPASKAPSKAPSKAHSKAATNRDQMIITVIEEQDLPPAPPKAPPSVHSSKRTRIPDLPPAPPSMALIPMPPAPPSMALIPMPPPPPRSLHSASSRHSPKPHKSKPQDHDEFIEEVTIKRTAAENGMVDVEVEEVREVTRRKYRFKVPGERLGEMRLMRRFDE